MSGNSVIPPLTVPGAKPPGAGAQVVTVQSLPDSLKSVSRALILEGEVVGQNQDGTTRVRTAEGTIDLTLKGRQPQPGARLEISVPAGSPPQQVTVRPLPPAPQGQPPKPQPAQVPPAPTPAPDSPSPPPSSPQAAPPRPIPAATSPATPVATQPQGQTSPPAAPVISAPSQQPNTSQPLPVPLSQAAPQTPPVQQGNYIPDTIQSQETGRENIPVQPRMPSSAPPLANSYQPPVQGQTPSVQAVALMPGQTVRLAPFPPAQGMAIMQATAALSTDAILTGLAKTALSAGKTVLESPGSTISAVMTKAQPNAPMKFFALMPPDIMMSRTSVLLKNTPLTSGTPAMPLTQNLSAPPTGTLSSILSTSAAPLHAAPTFALSQLDAKILSVIPPNTYLSPKIGDNHQIMPPQNQASALSNGAIATVSAGLSFSSMTATVVGITPQNLPLVIVQWPGQGASAPMALQFPADNLVPGTQIVLQPVQTAAGGTASASGALSSPARPQWPLLSASPVWPALDDAYQGLAQASPQLSQLLSRIVPAPGMTSGFAPAAILFAAAMRTGDLSGWLGERKIDALLKAGKSPLLARLAQDIGTAARASESQTEWKTYPLPLLWQGEIAKIMLHVHHEPPGGEKESKEGSTRFVMDLSLTRMGEVQLDGLVRGKRLDLIVRTELPVSVSMQDAMKKAYADALDGGDIFGEVGFQSDRKGWAQILKREDMLIQTA